MLKTRHIFIDTQTFVANNFFDNENLKRLAEFGNREIINIYLTDITINEIKSNIKEDLINAQEEINRFKTSISGKSRILKNIPEYMQYIDLPKLDLDVDFNKIEKELESFIVFGKVSIIPYNIASLEEIIKKYFNKEKPFGTGKKKYEFPDAIVLSAIEQWCLLNNCQIYIISNDTDMSEYVSRNLLPIPKIRTILDLIIKYESDRLDWITKIFKESQEQIKEKIGERFKEKLSDELFFKIKILNIDIEDVTLYEESIVQDNLETNETIFQLEFDIYYSVMLEYEHLFTSSLDYDIGADRWTHKERRMRGISLSSTESAEIAIETDYSSSIKEEQSLTSIFCSYCSIPSEEHFYEELENNE